MSRTSVARASGVLVAALLLAGCGAATPDEPLDPAAAVALIERDDPVVVDVRTEEEYATGHLDGALLLDIQGGGFEAGLAELDPSVPTVVYCRTGNRSAAAVERMRELGFVEVHDAGGLDDLAAAGARLSG